MSNEEFQQATGSTPKAVGKEAFTHSWENDFSSSVKARKLKRKSTSSDKTTENNVNQVGGKINTTTLVATGGAVTTAIATVVVVLSPAMTNAPTIDAGSLKYAAVGSSFNYSFDCRYTKDGNIKVSLESVYDKKSQNYELVLPKSASSTSVSESSSAESVISSSNSDSASATSSADSSALLSISGSFTNLLTDHTYVFKINNGLSDLYSHDIKTGSGLLITSLAADPDKETLTYELSLNPDISYKSISYKVTPTYEGGDADAFTGTHDLTIANSARTIAIPSTVRRGYDLSFEVFAQEVGGTERSQGLSTVSYPFKTPTLAFASATPNYDTKTLNYALTLTDPDSSLSSIYLTATSANDPTTTLTSATYADGADNSMDFSSFTKGYLVTLKAYAKIRHDANTVVATLGDTFMASWAVYY
jgi:hypothetical protein